MMRLISVRGVSGVLFSRLLALSATVVFIACAYSSMAGAGAMSQKVTPQDKIEKHSHQVFAVDFSSLPLDLAIKRVKGNGQRKMAYLTDPNCGYCKKLENELRKVDNVTLYLFLYPIFPGSDEKVKAVWCSRDRAAAWDDLMLNNARLPAGTCDTPSANVLKLGEKLNISGTPTLIFSDGVIAPGYLTAPELDQALSGNSGFFGSTPAAMNEAIESKARVFLTKPEILKISVDKKLVFIRASDGNKVQWDIQDNGLVFGNNLTQNKRDSGTWRINEDGQLCVKWREGSTNRCVAFFREGGKIKMAESQEMDGIFAELVKE